MAKKKVNTDIQTNESVADSLAKTIASDLNSAYKRDLGTVAYVGGSESPSDIVGWISTGNPMLDLAISNRPYGGLPIGRIVEITGLEGSGKSLLAAHVLAETQKIGGLAVYIDTEAALSTDFFRAIGMNIDDMLHLAMYKLEDIFEAIERIITKVRESGKDRVVTIVVDSIMGARTNAEEEADYGKDGYATAKAIILSKAMRKITSLIASEKILLILTNQLRTRLGVSFGDPWTTSGGKAIAFHSSVRIRLKSVGKIKVKNNPDGTVGVKTNASIIKNRLGPPHRDIDFDIYFESGMDAPGSWLEMLKKYNLVTQSGQSYLIDLVDKDTGEVITKKFQSKDFHELLQDEKIRTLMYEKICDEYIMKYRPNDGIGIDDIAIDPNVEHED